MCTFLDASDYALGVYDCRQLTSFRRQFSVEEGEELDIAMKEILAIKMLVQNVDLSSRPRVLRYGEFSQKYYVKYYKTSP